MSNVVTLLTDFGSEDSYVAEVKAVLLSAKSNLTLIDITHEIYPYDIEGAAFQLLRAYAHFPKGTVHLAVVDPGVGTDRRGVYVRTKHYFFIGPDNGILLWAVRDCERREKRKAEVFEIPAVPDIPPTFHARDLFAPFAGRILKGKRLKLPHLKSLEGREFPGYLESDGKRIGEIIGPDRFGNVVTSIPIQSKKRVEAQMEGRSERLKFALNYESIEGDHVAVIAGSHGFWELATRESSAWDRLGVKRGDRVIVFF